MDSYSDFLRRKAMIAVPTGISEDVELNPAMKGFQAAGTRFMIRRGRAAMFEACGLGKTFQELEFLRVVHEHTNKNCLLYAPLAVAQQTVAEGKKFGIEVNYRRQKHDVTKGITITNYDMRQHFDPSEFIGVGCDESSLIKCSDSATFTDLCERHRHTPYKGCYTATPSPNDWVELGTHAEFLGIMTRAEMLATYFVHDGGNTSEWRLKGHAEEKFWKWVASWAIMARTPADLGFNDPGYDLPPLNLHKIILDDDTIQDGFLFAMPANTLSEQRKVKRDSMNDRVAAAAKIANRLKTPCVVWGELNPECDMLEKAIKQCVQVAGKDPREVKEKRLMDFAEGRVKDLVSKLDIAGFGMNFQHCHNQVFMNLSHSWERFHQGISRSLRFGQLSAVDIWLILTRAEAPILESIQDKQRGADTMAARMVEQMHDTMIANLGGTVKHKDPYNPQVKMEIPKWVA